MNCASRSARNIAAAVLLPKLAALKTQVENLIHSRDTQRADIQRAQSDIVQIALKTPAAQTPPANPPNS